MRKRATLKPQESLGLSDKDFTLLGETHSNVLSPRYSETDESCQVTAEAVPISFWFSLGCLIAYFISILFLLLLTISDDGLFLHITFHLSYTALLVFFFYLLRIFARGNQQLKSSNPLLFYDAENQTIAILNSQHEFLVDQVASIILLGERDHRNYVAELQLVIDSAEGTERYLLDAARGSLSSAYRREVIKFAEKSDLVFLHVERVPKWWRKGELKVTKRTPGLWRFSASGSVK